MKHIRNIAGTRRSPRLEDMRNSMNPSSTTLLNGMDKRFSPIMNSQACTVDILVGIGLWLSLHSPMGVSELFSLHL
jgi:hypothetical protein